MEQIEERYLVDKIFDLCQQAKEFEAQAKKLKGILLDKVKRRKKPCLLQGDRAQIEIISTIDYDQKTFDILYDMAKIFSEESELVPYISSVGAGSILSEFCSWLNTRYGYCISFSRPKLEKKEGSRIKFWFLEKRGSDRVLVKARKE